MTQPPNLNLPDDDKEGDYSEKLLKGPGGPE